MLALAPFWTIVVILVIILVVWLVLRSQSSRDDLGAVESHDDHAHHDHAHAEEKEAPAPAEPDA